VYEGRPTKGRGRHNTASSQLQNRESSSLIGPSPVGFSKGVGAARKLWLRRLDPPKLGVVKSWGDIGERWLVAEPQTRVNPLVTAVLPIGIRKARASNRNLKRRRRGDVLVGLAKQVWGRRKVLLGGLKG